MSRHAVTTAEFTDWANGVQNNWMTFASSHGRGSNKNLKVVLAHPMRFQVTDHGKEVYMGSCLGAAIHAYNLAE